jgi:4'-phosphopantetheinyl transferase
MTGVAVQVRRLRLDLPGAALARLFATLGPEERARAFRFAAERERARFVAARGQLRAILGETLGRAPESFVFARGAAGKPRLDGQAFDGPGLDGGAALRFSVAHSGGAMVVALARGVEVGIDIERRRALPIDPVALARAAFAPSELRRLAGLSPAEREECWLRLWVRREAVLKALGVGLRSPDLIEVAEGPEPRLLALADGSDPALWTIRDLDLGPCFLAALAAPVTRLVVVPFRFGSSYDRCGAAPGRGHPTHSGKAAVRGARMARP